MLDGVESQTVDLTNETGASSSAAAAGDAGHVESYSSATNLRLDGLPSASQASSTEHLYGMQSTTAWSQTVAFVKLICKDKGVEAGAHLPDVGR